MSYEGVLEPGQYEFWFTDSNERYKMGDGPITISRGENIKEYNPYQQAVTNIGNGAITSNGTGEVEQNNAGNDRPSTVNTIGSHQNDVSCPKFKKIVFIRFRPSTNPEGTKRRAIAS